MKKIKIISIVLIVAIISSSTVSHQVKAKDIYFAGRYKMNYYSSNEYFVLDMNQYSSPEGKEKGNFTIGYVYKPTGYHPWYEGTLSKIGKNKYQYKNGKIKITFKVYKNKVSVNGNKYCDDSIFGKYKLEERFYS